MTARVVGYLGAAVCLVAGIYLLQYQGTTAGLGGSAGTSWFEILGHGIGIYFIGKGVALAASAHQQAAEVSRLDELIRLASVPRLTQKEPPRLWKAGRNGV